MSLLAFVLIFPLVTLTQWNDTIDFNQKLRAKTIKSYQTSSLKSKFSSSYQNEFANINNASWYEKKVNREYFTMQIFKHAKSYHDFTLVTLLVSFFLLLPHILLFSMMRNKNFNYQTKVREHYRSMIQENYQQLEIEANKLLAKYDKSIYNVNMTFLQKGNPYIEESEEMIKENISFKQYQKQLNISQTIS
jgi:hypothetical protein